VQILIRADRAAPKKISGKCSQEFRDQLLRLLYIVDPPQQKGKRGLDSNGRILAECDVQRQPRTGNGARIQITTLFRATLAVVSETRRATGAFTDVSQLRDGLASAGDGDEFFLKFAGDWAGNAFADLDVIYERMGSDFDGGATKTLHPRCRAFREGRRFLLPGCSGLPQLREASRVMPQMLVARGGVYSTPSCTRKTFMPEPSLTWPSVSRAMPSRSR